MSSQRPPTSTRASWEYNDNEWQHLSDDVLLAYVRRQHLDNFIEIEQHVAACPFCGEKCRAFEQSSGLLAGWVQDKGQQIHPSVTHLVMQRIVRESSCSPGERIIGHLRQTYKYSLLETLVQRIMGKEDAQSKRWAAGLDVSPLSPLTDEPLPGPFADLQTRSFAGLRSGMANPWRPRSLKRPAIALVIAAAVFTVFIGLFVSPRILPGITAGSMNPKAINVPNQSSTPAKQKATPTPTRLTPVPSEPRISFCSSQNAGKHNSIHICGNGFTPGGRVWLAVYGPAATLLSKSADTQGDVDIPFNLNSCRPISLLIIAVDDSSHKTAILSTSSFSNCPVSRRR